MRRILVGVLAAGVILAGCSGNTVGGANSSIPTSVATTTSTTLPSLVAAFDWSMPARFGLDGNLDGRIDLPNTSEYVHNVAPGSCPAGCPPAPPTFSVLLSGSSSTSEVGPIDSYRWEVRSGTEVVAEAASPSAETEMSLAEGSYDVSLTIGVGDSSATVTEEIDVQDHLIVSIGDSFASGEGNPEATGSASGPFGDRPIGIWADDGGATGGRVAEEHRRAHRSTLAGPAQAALDLEASSDASSVTFLSLASSGASIDTGLLEPHPGVPYEDAGQAELRPQIDALADLLGCSGSVPPQCNRTIDALTISIGGNDMGFGLVWGGLVAADPDLAIGPSYRLAVNAIFLAAEGGIDRLPAAFATLDQAIDDRLQAENIFITAYPSLVGTTDGVCEEAATDLVPGLEVDRDEILEGIERVFIPLNLAVADAAGRHGWNFVDGHLEPFDLHGLCGDEPYPADRYPGNPYPERVTVPADESIRWFRQAEESAAIQGAPDTGFRPADLATRGTLHPNEYGHQAIKEALLAAPGFPHR